MELEKWIASKTSSHNLIDRKVNRRALHLSNLKGAHGRPTSFLSLASNHRCEGGKKPSRLEFAVAVSTEVARSRGKMDDRFFFSFLPPAKTGAIVERSRRWGGAWNRTNRGRKKERKKTEGDRRYRVASARETRAANRWTRARCKVTLVEFSEDRGGTLSRGGEEEGENGEQSPRMSARSFSEHNRI